MADFVKYLSWTGMCINIYVHVFVTALLLQADGEIIRQYFLHFVTDVFQ